MLPDGFDGVLRAGGSIAAGWGSKGADAGLIEPYQCEHYAGNQPGERTAVRGLGLFHE